MLEAGLKLGFTHLDVCPEAHAAWQMLERAVVGHSVELSGEIRELWLSRREWWLRRSLAGSGTGSGSAGDGQARHNVLEKLTQLFMHEC